MIWLLIGVVLWSALHFLRSLAPGLRANLLERLGEKAYRGVFSLAILASIALMVLGWRMGEQANLYFPTESTTWLGRFLILIAFLLFGLAASKTNVKRFIRHPQLTGMIVWAAGHLMANGDNLSVTLFGGLGLWAIAEIFLINRREGSWQRPDPLPLTSEIKPIVIGLVVFMVVMMAHPFLFGVSPLPTRG